MAREQELKLSVAATSEPRILQWLGELNADPLPRQWLSNTYFDTADAKLNRQRIALRIRHSDVGYVQTLKTKGSASQGIHDRQEWDWPLHGPQLDTQVLKDSPIAQLAVEDDLQVVFRTDFERLPWLWRKDGEAIEFALDRGEVRTPSQNRRSVISEIELELKAGDTATLVTQARAVSDTCPVFLDPVSKAEQGYFIAGLYHPTDVELQPGSDFTATVDAWFQALGYFALTGQGRFLDQAGIALQHLARICVSLPDRTRTTPEQFSQLLQYQCGMMPGSPGEARAQILQEPLFGQFQLRLIGPR